MLAAYKIFIYIFIYFFSIYIVYMAHLLKHPQHSNGTQSNQSNQSNPSSNSMFYRKMCRPQQSQQKPGVPKAGVGSGGDEGEAEES